MPFRSSKVQSRVMDTDTDDDQPISPRSSRFPSLPFLPTSRNSRCPPSVSQHTSYLPTGAWWKSLTPVCKTNEEEERGRFMVSDADGSTGGVLEQDDGYRGRGWWDGGRIGKWRRLKQVLELIALFTVGFLLLVIAVWCVRKMGSGRRMENVPPKVHEWGS